MAIVTYGCFVHRLSIGSRVRFGGGIVGTTAAYLRVLLGPQSAFPDHVKLSLCEVRGLLALGTLRFHPLFICLSPVLYSLVSMMNLGAERSTYFLVILGFFEGPATGAGVVAPEESVIEESPSLVGVEVIGIMYGRVAIGGPGLGSGVSAMERSVATDVGRDTRTASSVGDESLNVCGAGVAT